MKCRYGGVGVKAETAKQIIKSWLNIQMGHPEDVKNVIKMEDKAYKELTELERIATEHLSPETQELIELGKAFKGYCISL